jgi:hypothetical protein
VQFRQQEPRSFTVWHERTGFDRSVPIVWP